VGRGDIALVGVMKVPSGARWIRLLLVVAVGRARVRAARRRMLGIYILSYVMFCFTCVCCVVPHVGTVPVFIDHFISRYLECHVIPVSSLNE
jgi:hypothetical protein